MNRLRAAALFLLVVAALAPPFSEAGSESDPELTDPAGDQVVVRTLPIVPMVNDDPFDDVDIQKAWIESGPGQQGIDSTVIAVNVTMRFGAPWQDTGHLELDLNVAKGPTSLATSTANGTTYAVIVDGLAISGAATGTATRSANDLVLALQFEDRFGSLTAAGGDLLNITRLAASRSDPGNDAVPLTQDDQSASDAAVAQKPHTLFRTPPVAGIAITITGGSIVDDDGHRSFSGTTTSSHHGNATILLGYRVTNTGTDADVVSIVPFTDGGTVTLIAEVQTFDLAPGETGYGQAQFRVTDATNNVTLRLEASSSRGATTTAIARVIIEAVPDELPPSEPVQTSERVPTPQGLKFLTPMAEGLSLDKALDRYAEAFLLAILVLIVILAIFLLLYLGASPHAAEAAGEAPPPRAKAAVAAATATASQAEVQRFDSAPIAGQVDVTIGAVHHEPARPHPGDKVTSAIVVENNEDRDLALRVVLSLDKRLVADKSIKLAAGSSERVDLEWTAGEGENRIRVQVFPSA